MRGAVKSAKLAVMKSKSSVPFTTSLPNDAAEAVFKISEQDGISAREVVRRAVCDYVKQRGFPVAPYSPTWGARTDLFKVNYKLLDKAIDEALRQLPSVPESIRRPVKSEKRKAE